MSRETATSGSCRKGSEPLEPPPRAQKHGSARQYTTRGHHDRRSEPLAANSRGSGAPPRGARGVRGLCDEHVRSAQAGFRPRRGLPYLGRGGRRYLDLLSGLAVNALGHAHPRVLSAVTSQIATLGHVSNFFATPAQVALAGRLTA